MGLLDFKYQAAIGDGQNKEQVAAKLTEILQSNGCTVSNQGGDLAVSGLKSYFNVGTATIRIDDKEIRIEGNVKPSIPAFGCIGASVVLDIFGLFKSCKIEDVLFMALVIALGAAGSIGTIITFFFGKEFMRHELALIVGRATK